MKGAIKFLAVNIIITCNDHNPSQLSDGDRGGGKRNKNDGCEYLYFSALVSTTINYCRAFPCCSTITEEYLTVVDWFLVSF